METATINVKVNTSEAQKSVNDLNKSIDQTATSTGSLKSQLKQITQELQGLQPGSARFVELTQRAGQLRDTIADTNAVINATAGNVTENLGKGLTSVASIGVAAFQSVTAAQTLLGVESEEVTKTIAKLTALMNLSQAIETFGGLGDKVTQIKASFMGLAQTLGIVTIAQQGTAVAATEVAVAETAEAVAADAAAVSTGAFAVSLNAIPFVAILTGIGLLVAGIAAYVSASEEASLAEEERKTRIEEANKAIKEEKDTIYGASAAFVSLVYQLKATNKESKERSTLINQINSTYGTTLQNIKDEGKFQEQLNLVVADYIAYQTVKYRLQQQEKAIIANLEEQDRLQSLINLSTQQYTQARDKANKADYMAGDQIEYADKLEAGLNSQKQALEDLKKAMLGIGNVSLQYQQTLDSLTKQGSRFGDQTKDNTKDIKDETKAIEENIDARTRLRETLKGTIEEQKAVSEREKEILKARQDSDKLLKLQAEAVDEVEKNRANGIYKTAEAYKNALGGIKSDSEEYLKNQLEVIKKEGEARQKASTVVIGGGGEDPAEKKKRLEREKSLKEEMDLIKKNFDQQLIDSETFQNILRAKEKEINDKWDLIDLQDKKLIELELQKIQLDSLRQQELNLATTEEQKTAIRKSYADRIRTNEEELIRQQAIIQLRDTTLTEDERVKIIKESENKILKLREKTIDDSTKKTRTELQTLAELRAEFTKSWSEDWIKTSQTLVSQIADITSQITALFSQAFQQAADNQLYALEQLTTQEQEQLDASLANREITEKDYQEKKKMLEDSAAEREKQIKIKEFRREKALNIVNAVMNTAVGITKALPNPVLITLASVLGAASVALIASQQFRAAKGGVVPQNGQSGNVDSVPSLLAPGEVVINSQSSQMYPQLLSDINQAGGGDRLVPDVAFTNPYNQTNVFQPQQQMVQAYVVESQITNSQRRISRMERAASF